MALSLPGNASEKPTSRLAGGVRALRHRNFQLFFSGQFISLIGTWMQTVAQSWLVYRLTGSSLLLGAVGFSSQIPVFIFAPLGGAAADRLDRQKIVIATQTASMTLAFVLAGLTLTHRIKIWEIFVIAALLGIVNAFDIPARQAFLLEMVTREDLINAIALNSSMFNGARVVGPAVAGLLVARVGEGWCFFANAASYIAVIVGLLLMNVKKAVTSGERNSALQDILEGFRFVWSKPPILGLLLLLGIISLVGTPYSVLMPIFADRILHSGAKGLGTLMGAAGVGALLGALTLTMRKGLSGLGTWVALAAGTFGVSLILFSFSHWFWISAVLLLPVGFSLMVQMASSNTLIQSMVPDRLRGRVMAVYSMMFMGMAPIGAILAGAVAHKFSAPLAVASGGVLAMVAALVFWFQLPGLRAQARELITAQTVIPENVLEELTTRSST
jgi:MFS family permease